MHHKEGRSAFTLIELLVVIAIIAILAVVVVLTLNPQALLQQSRDSNRVSDMSTLVDVLGQYNTDQSGSASFNMGSSSVVYMSIPDPSATSSAGDQCQGLGLLTLPSGYTYHCAATSTYRNVNGTGWIPVNFQNMSTGAPLGVLPVDPTNNSSSRLYYTYTTNGTQYEVTSNMESAKYQLGGSNDVISGDGGLLATVYEKGSKLGLEPLDYGDTTLQGYWPFLEGTGSFAYDHSGNGVNQGYITAWGSGSIEPYAVSTVSTPGGASSYTYGVFPYFATITMVAWINTGTSSSNAPIMEIGNGSYTGPYLRQVGTYLGSVLSNGPCGILTSTTTPITSGTWQMVGYTYDGTNEIIYDNGVAIASMTASCPLNPGSNIYTVSNGYSLGGGTSFVGLLDDERIYSRALSAAQMAALYKGGK